MRSWVRCSLLKASAPASSSRSSLTHRAFALRAGHCLRTATPLRWASAVPIRWSHNRSRRLHHPAPGELHESLNLEPVGPQQSDPVPVPEVVFNCRGVRPLEAVHAELRSEEAIAHLLPLLVGVAEHQERAVSRNTRSPPGRRRRAASGIQRYGSAQIAAPYSLMTRSKACSRSGTCSPTASTSGNHSLCSSWNCRAIRSCPGVGSTPTGMAPRRASQADTYAVPHPSSTVLVPLTSAGKMPATDSGTWKLPQVGSGSDHCRRASRNWSSRRASQYRTFVLT